MKLRHWLFLLFFVLGVLFFAHNYLSHGGVAGVKQGIGLGGFGRSA